MDVSGVSGTGTQTFGYDNQNRVTGSTGLSGEGRAYSYDRDGNRVQKSDTVGGTTTTIDYAFDRTGEPTSALVSTGGPPTNPATFDVFGNLTGDAESGTGPTAMTYDAADRLTGIDDGTPPIARSTQSRPARTRHQ
jgi:YD repeat-containing protein